MMARKNPRQTQFGNIPTASKAAQTITPQEDPRLKQISSRTTFNPDKSVTEEMSGSEPKTFSPKEWAAMQSTKRGEGSQGMQLSNDAQRILAQEKYIAEQHALGLTYAEIFDQIAQAPVLAQQAQQTQALDQQRTANAQGAAQSVGQYEQLPDDEAATFGTRLKGAGSDIAEKTVTDVATFAASGAGIGAIAGLGAGSPLTAPIGAGIGAAAGLAKSLVSDINILKRQAGIITQAQMSDFTTSKTAITKIIKAANMKTEDPQVLADLFDEQLALIDRADRNLKELSKQPWTQEVRANQIKVQNWNLYQKQVFIRQFQEALLHPNPNAVYMGDLEAPIEEQ